MTYNPSNIFLLDDEVYMLVQLGINRYNFISLSNGNRWCNSPVMIKEPLNDKHIEEIVYSEILRDEEVKIKLYASSLVECLQNSKTSYELHILLDPSDSFNLRT